jgi:transmembrane sensor
MSERTYDDDSSASRAAEWLARLGADDVSASDRAEFQAWLTESPAHRRAFDEAQGIWSDLDALAGVAKSAPEKLTPGLRADIAACGPLISTRLEAPRRAARTQWWLGLAAGLVLGVAGALLLVHSGLVMSPAPATAAAAAYRTQVGERRQVMLADGSVVWLNTNTELSVALTPAQRSVHLVSGEACFTVAKDRQRPFVVTAGEGVVKAVGTSFNVYHRSDATRVTVIEGVVEVSGTVVNPVRTAAKARTSVAPPKPLTLRAAQAASVEEGETKLVELRPETAATTASWRGGKLYFDAVPLKDMVAEIDNYLPARIVIADDSIAGFVGGGVVHVENAQSILKAIEMAWPVQVTYESPDVIVITRRN